MKIVEKNCSCSHSTKLKLLDWHQNPLAQKWHRNDQISPNSISVLPDSTGKELEVIIFQVYILGLYHNVTFKHTETKETYFGGKINIFLIYFFCPYV